MNFYLDTLTKAAEISGVKFEIGQSPKSEAVYAYILNENESGVVGKVRFAGHEAMCSRSKSDIEVDGCMILDYGLGYFQSEWTVDSDGDVVVCEDEVEFETEIELSNHMAKIIAIQIKCKF